MDTNQAVKQQISGVFDRASAAYDRTGPSMFSYFGKKLVERAGLKAGQHVLDVACGRGAVLLPAVAAVGPGGYVVGIDLSREMVIRLQEEIDGRGIGNAEAQVMDAECPDFPDGSFDAVLCGLSVFFFPNYSAAFRAYHRLLRPDGLVGFTVWGAGDERWQPVDAVIKAHREQLEAIHGKKLTHASAGHLNRPGELARTLETAGFHDVQEFGEAIELVYASEEEWWAVQWSHAVRNVLEWIEQTGGKEALERFKEDVFAALQPLRQADGFHQVWRAQVVVAKR